jgi:Na+-translocating ferredoxin:NAD+ oxidoreductase RnfA subunit
MSNFFVSVYEGVKELLSFFVTIALLQNIVLTTGFGSSSVLRVVRKPRNVWMFSAMLTVFCVLTVVIAFPLDRLFGVAVTNFWRPLMLIGITALLYILAVLLLKQFLPSLYARISRTMPLAAFNSLVVGVALVANVQFTSTINGIIGLAVGACLGFTLLTFIVDEGIERLDNPDMPDAFRGMPATLVYIGILALALMGFTSDFSLS